MDTQDSVEQIADLETLLEIAKDCLLENKPKESYKLLQQANRQLRRIIWQITPLNFELD